MCVVSMVMDHYWDKWSPPYRPIGPVIPITPVLPFVPTAPYAPPISPAEIEEFRKLLERARRYDRDHNEPDCELEEKRQRLKDLAEELKIEIDFL